MKRKVCKQQKAGVKPSVWRSVLALTVALLPVAAALLASCSTTGNKNCQESTDVFLYADIRSAATGALQEVVFDCIKGVGTDSVWMESTSLTSVTLPLQPNADTTIFILDMRAAGNKPVADTLTMVHTNRPFVLSMECGGIVIHTLKAVSCTHQRFDSVTIEEPEVKNVTATHLTLWMP